MSWYHKYINHPTVALHESRQYMDAITPLFLIQENQRDCAIFSRLDENTGGVHYYFTPKAGNCISIHATSCNSHRKMKSLSV